MVQDSRFTTVVSDVEDLLAVVDLDEVRGLEDLFMALLARPVDLVAADGGLQLTLHGRDSDVEWVEELPFSLVDLAHECIEVCDDLAPWPGAPAAGADASTNDDELITAFQEALGRVRLLGMLED